MRQETRDLIELQISSNLGVLSRMEVYQLDEDNDKVRMRTVEETCKLIDKLEMSEKNEWEAWNSQEQLRIDEERNKNSGMTDKQRLIVEIGSRIVVPILTFIGGVWSYDIFQSKVLKFEEFGRITSSAGRDLHLPKFMK